MEIQAMIAVLSTQLQAAPRDAMDRCESMYRAIFRSEPEKASVYWDGSDVEVREDFEAEFNVPYDPDLLVVELCNYKGEGEGWDTFAAASSLPVWRSKSHSAAVFGA